MTAEDPATRTAAGRRSRPRRVGGLDALARALGVPLLASDLRADAARGEAGARRAPPPGGRG